VRITESKIRRLIRDLLIEACETPDERNPDEDEQTVRDIWEDIKDEFKNDYGYTYPKLGEFLDRTTLNVIKDENDENYKKATKNLGDTASALFRSLDVRSQFDWLDVMLRKAAHERGEHNTVYYHLYGPEQNSNCLDVELVESQLRHELEHFIDKMSLFTDERSTRSEDQDDVVDGILDPSLWNEGVMDEEPPDIFVNRWYDKGGYTSWQQLVSVDEDERMNNFWHETIMGQWKDYLEAYAVLKTVKKFLSDKELNITHLVSMDLGEISDLGGGGDVTDEHLISVALLARDECSDIDSECFANWDFLY
jgi:hypothetical protein